jgi:site-specific recombinase XerD
MLSLYRRHEDACRFRAKGVRHIKCSCPIWMDGYDQKGKRRRQSLKTRSWPHAQARLVEIEGGRVEIPKPAEHSPRLAVAIASYLDDCRARKLEPSTIVSYTNTLDHLVASFPNRSVAGTDLVALTKFRNERKIAATDSDPARSVTASTSSKEIQTLRAFFKFCKARKWVADNPAKELKAPKSDRLPTMPFTDAEVTRILEACGRIDNPNPREIHRARLRARALVLTLLYSGFRISDAVKLRRADLDMKTGQLMVRLMKTRAPLYIRLPQVALDALAAVPVESLYFFWSGKSKLSTAI